MIILTMKDWYSYQSFIVKIIINLFHHISLDNIAGMGFVKHYGLQTFFCSHSFYFGINVTIFQLQNKSMIRKVRGIDDERCDK